MARMIDGDALYETIEDHVTTVSVCPTADWAFGKTQMKKICLEDIKNAPTVGGWISVKNMLPEENGRYLVSVVEGYMELYLWIDGVWFSSVLNVCDDGFVTHWMPLPEPPKEDDDAGQ